MAAWRFCREDGQSIAEIADNKLGVGETDKCTSKLLQFSWWLMRGRLTDVYGFPSLILKGHQWNSTMCPFLILQNHYWVWLTHVTLKKSNNTEEVTNIFFINGKKRTQNLVLRLIMMWLKVVKKKVFLLVLTWGSVRILWNKFLLHAW